jgi:hypothetical protein
MPRLYKARIKIKDGIKEIEVKAWSKLNLRDHLATEYNVNYSDVKVINPAKETFDDIQEKHST